MPSTRTDVITGSLGQRALAALDHALSLGDERLDARAVQMARQSMGGTSASIVSLFGEVENSSHFLSTADVDLMALRRALYEVSWEEVLHRDLQHVVAIFDPSILMYHGHHSKQDMIEDLGEGHGKGYIWLNLGLADPVTGSFLGVAHQTLVGADGPDDREEISYVAEVPARKRKALREEFESSYKNQFIVHATQALKNLPPGVEVTLTADREFDDGLVLRKVTQGQANVNFVIRSNSTRKVYVHKPKWLPNGVASRTAGKHETSGFVPAADEVCVTTDVLVENMPLTFLRELPLDSRGRACASGGHARVARLGVGTIPVCVATRSHRAIRARIKEEPVGLNLVVVRELNPVRRGQGICWVLLTDRPVNTPTQLERVVDCYVARWRIEEFFRTTKDVLGLEDSRLDDPGALARLLFFVTFRAMCLDTLRYEAGLDAGSPPTNEQVVALRAGARQVDQIEEMTASERREALRALTPSRKAFLLVGKIAQLGRWSAKRGKHLGNHVLVKGLDLFLHDLAMGHFRWLLERTP
jgi:hypothetical protein